MRKVTKTVLVLVLALAPVLGLTWSGQLEWYARMSNADVRVNGQPAGYLHRGYSSSVVTRTDVPGNHSYRIWQTAREILIFDCPNWVAPDWRYFAQGKVANPCIYPTTKVRADSPTSPELKGTVKDGRLYFTTRDGSVISLREQIWNRASMR